MRKPDRPTVKDPVPELLERAYLQGFTDGTQHERAKTAVNPHDLFETWLETQKSLDTK